MLPGDHAPPSDLDGLLESLDSADAALRAKYQTLAREPDLAAEFEGELRELHATRLRLAQQVGLAVLARKRATPQVEARSPTLPTPVEASLPAPPPPDPPEPISERASDADVAQWKSEVQARGMGVGLRTAPSTATAWPLVLHELMEALGPPRSVDTTIGTIEELEALDDIATPEHQQLWARLPKHAQQVWLSMLVARTRVLKELPSLSVEAKAQLKVIITRYPAWAKVHAPGHVNGLQVKHEPRNGSWALDARDHWNTLDDMLGEQLVSRPSSATKKKTKRPESPDDVPEIDPASPVLPLVRGRRAVIVGGDPREPNRQRLERAFQLASLDWPPVDGPRKLDSVVESIRRGGYDLVLVLAPFVAHKQSNAIVEAAKETPVPWALVEGYGVPAVKLGVERFLGGPRTPVSLRQDDGANGHHHVRG